MESTQSQNELDEQYKKSIHYCALELLHDRIMCRREKPEDTKVMLKHALKIIDNYTTLFTAVDLVSC